MCIYKCERFLVFYCCDFEWFFWFLEVFLVGWWVRVNGVWCFWVIFYFCIECKECDRINGIILWLVCIEDFLVIYFCDNIFV